MSVPHDEEQVVASDQGHTDEAAPEQVPPKAWLTYVVFAMFIIGVASCSPLWLFG